MWRRCSIDVHDSPCRRKILAIGTIPKPFGRGNRLRRRRPWKSKTYYCLYRKAYKLAFFGRFVDPLNRDFRKDETFARQGLKSKVLVANPRPSGHRNRRWSKSGLGILYLSWKSLTWYEKTFLVHITVFISLFSFIESLQQQRHLSINVLKIYLNTYTWTPLQLNFKEVLCRLPFDIASCLENASRCFLPSLCSVLTVCVRKGLKWV